MTGRPVTRPITVVEGSERSLKIIPARGERLPFTLRANSLATADVTRLNNRISANFTTFMLRGRAAGETLLEIASANGVRTLPIAVRVIERLTLPVAGNDIGMLTRLFLAEADVPDNVDQVEIARQAMLLMRVVIDNRLAKPSSRWGSAGATSRIDVVRARGQFAGFANYPAISTAIQREIDETVRIANTADDPSFGRVRAHLRNAIAIASGPKPNDPTRTGLYWWRTEKQGASGTAIILYATLGGNTFYREGP